jgi:hypothetical protein
LPLAICAASTAAPSIGLVANAACPSAGARLSVPHFGEAPLAAREKIN